MSVSDERIERAANAYLLRQGISLKDFGKKAKDDILINMRAALEADAPLMHLKTYCADGATLRTGSVNFSRSGLIAQDNDLIVLRDAAACARFDAKFAKAWGP